MWAVIWFHNVHARVRTVRYFSTLSSYFMNKITFMMQIILCKDEQNLNLYFKASEYLD